MSSRVPDWPGSTSRGSTSASPKTQYVSGVVDFIERLPPHLVIHRLTSDPHAEELVAPAWCLDKPRVMKRIREEFVRRGTRQGSHLMQVSLLSGHLISRGRKDVRLWNLRR